MRDSVDTKEITVNLDDADDAAAFDVRSCFFNKERKTVYKFIRETADKARRLRGCERHAMDHRVLPREPADRRHCSAIPNTLFQEHWHQHHAIMVSGRRGVGKTSFILGLRDYIDSVQRRSRSDNEPCVLVLKAIDPTMIESGEVFLATVTAHLAQQLSCLQLEDASHEFDRRLQRVAAAFPVLSEGGEPSRLQGCTGSSLRLAGRRQDCPRSVA